MAQSWRRAWRHADERSAKIRAELDDAQALRDEALAELKNYQRLHREAADEAKAIVKAAEATAERIRETAEKAVAAVKRREQQADAKIKAAEASMLAELRDRASLAIALHRNHLVKADNKTSLALVDKATAEIEKLN